MQAGLLITLENPNWSACSASLVSHQHLLSAAHCWYDGMDQAALYTVVLGSKQLFEGGLRIDTSDVVVHPEWDPDTLSNDISILYLPKKIRFSGMLIVQNLLKNLLKNIRSLLVGILVTRLKGIETFHHSTDTGSNVILMVTIEYINKSW